MKSRHPVSMPGRQRKAGFTLIEVMVVVAIIALSAGMLGVGYNILASKRLDSEAEKMSDWFEAVAESAVFRSMVLGVRAEENLLQVVAFYDNRWFHINGVDPYQITENIQWEVETEERIDFGQDLETEEREPFVAFLPSGQALPEGALSIHRAEDSAILSWDDNADFELNLGGLE